jgi:outer membrane protein assembly factor BamB
MSLREHLKSLAGAAALGCLISLAGCAGGCSCNPPTTSWQMWRSDQFRSATQLFETALNDPNQVSTLHVSWTFTNGGPEGFRASPVVFNDGTVFIGDSNGYFYALAGNDGHKLWQYPAQGSAGLTQKFDPSPPSNPSAFGIASSATFATIGTQRAVIFGAPDQSSGSHLGDGHLFAVDTSSGALIWESPPIAMVTGLTSGSTGESHQQIGYSSPLVFNNLVYIGIADHEDNPIQQGKLVAVNLADGTINGAFTFNATATRGGGIWGSAAAWSSDVFVTTGNTRCWSGGACQAEPTPNYGLSMLRLNQNSGSVVWQHQPVPYAFDNDPDWAAGPAIMYAADCGPAIVSTQKDGWTWAVQAGNGAPGPPSVMWAFPPGPWSSGGFKPGDGTSMLHWDYDYKRPGATWGDVFIGTMGGWEVIPNVNEGYQQLHALNVCASDTQRVRWLKDIPSNPAYSGSSNPLEGTYPLGPPTVTVDGMVFVGTNQGHIVAVADPTLKAPLGNRCEDPGISNAQCTAHGRRLVPDPWIHDVALPGSPNDGIFGELVIANGNIYVATISGHVYMLQP